MTQGTMDCQLMFLAVVATLSPLGSYCHPEDSPIAPHNQARVFTMIPTDITICPNDVAIFRCGAAEHVFWLINNISVENFSESAEPWFESSADGRESVLYIRVLNSTYKFYVQCRFKIDEDIIYSDAASINILIPPLRPPNNITVVYENAVINITWKSSYDNLQQPFLYNLYFNGSDGTKYETVSSEPYYELNLSMACYSTLSMQAEAECGSSTWKEVVSLEHLKTSELCQGLFHKSGENEDSFAHRNEMAKVYSILASLAAILTLVFIS